MVVKRVRTEIHFLYSVSQFFLILYSKYRTQKAKINGRSIFMSENNEMVQVLTVEDLARILAISKNTAYDLVRSGKIRSVKIGRTYRIPKAALEEYLKSAA